MEQAEREMVLIEGLFQEGNQQAVDWTFNELFPLLVYPMPTSKGTGVPFFGSLLLAPLQSSNRRFLCGLQAGFEPACKEDWKEWADSLFSSGRWLASAHKVVTSHRLPTVDIWIMIPYPRYSVASFGKVKGSMLSMSSEADRCAALEWWIGYTVDGFKKYVQDKWGAGLATPALRLRGMVWGRESISEPDRNVVIQTNLTLQRRGLERLWLPNFGAAYLTEWRALGFSRVSLFANYTGPTEYGIDMLRNASQFALSQRTGLQVICGRGTRFDETHFRNYMEQHKRYASAGGSGPIVYRFPNHSLYTLYREHPDTYRQVYETVASSRGGGT